MSDAPADGRLRGGRFEARPKSVTQLKQFRDYVGVARNADLVADLEKLVKAIEDGTRLPDHFYRAGIDRDRDRLLDEQGVKHVHLNGRASDVLVFLVEYDDRVVFLEINDHKHFRTDPPGSLLRALHDAALTAEDRAAALRRDQRAAARRAVVRRGINPRRPR